MRKLSLHLKTFKTKELFKLLILISFFYIRLLSANSFADTFQNELSLLKDIPKSHAQKTHGELDSLLENIVQGKKGSITEGLTFVDTKFLQQFPDGSFKDQQLADEISFIVSISRAFEALKEDKLLWPKYKIKIENYYPRIKLALEFIYQNREIITTDDKIAPDRLFKDANVFFLSSKLIGKKIHLDWARSIQTQGLSLFDKNSNNQCTSLLALMYYVTAYPSKNLDQKIIQAASWQVSKILPDGSVTNEDALMALQMFDYYAALFTDSDARDIAKKIYRHIAARKNNKKQY